MFSKYISLEYKNGVTHLTVTLHLSVVPESTETYGHKYVMTAAKIPTQVMTLTEIRQL